MKQSKLHQLPLGRRSSPYGLATLFIFCFLTITIHAKAQCVNVNSNKTFATGPFTVVTDPENAYDLSDGDISTAAELVVNYFGIATLNVSFNENANLGDSVIVMFGIPTANLLDWESWGSTTFTPYSGTNAKGTPSATYTASALTFPITVGTTSLSRIAIPVTAAAGAKSVQIQFAAHMGDGGSKRNYIYDVAVKPGPVTSGSDTTICNGTEVVLHAYKNALFAQPVDLLWYDSDGTTLLYTDLNHSGAPYTGSFTTPVLTATQTFYIRERWNGCTLLSDARPVTVTVREPINPVIDINCTDPVTLFTTTTGAEAPVSYLWSAADGGSIVAGADSAHPKISGSGTYSVVITDVNTCTGSGTAAFNEGDCIALNLELLFFEIKGESTAAILEWEIAGTDAAVRFEVERSTDDKNWEKIGTVLPTVGSNFNSYIDEQAGLIGKHLLYRLLMIETDGNYSYSEIRTLDFDYNDGVALSLYPNPLTSESELNILTDHPETVKSVTVFNVAGKQMLQTTKLKEINMDALVPGLYLVQIDYTNGSRSSHKIAKQ